jgi:protein transport protein SEC61 subunit gamma-like protein
MDIQEYKRVLTITHKPGKDEFKRIVFVTGLGIMVIGLIGFSITLIKQVFL